MFKLFKKVSNFKLNKKINEIAHQEKEISLLNEHRISIYDKKVSKTAIDTFFEKLENGTFKKFFEDRSKNEKRNKREEEWISKGQIVCYRERTVFPITKSVLGTVRIFDKIALTAYLERANLFYEIIQRHQNNFEHFQIQPINILGIKKLKSGKYAMLEKVYPSIPLAEHNELNRYFKASIRFLKNRKIETNEIEFNRLLNEALKEYRSVGLGIIDTNYNNILFLDYNPKTKRFLFGPIDFVGSTKSLP